MPKKTQRMVYAKGKSVFELIDPDGHIYVLQAHDAQFPIESLAKLGEQMKQLPKGWQYRTRALTEDLVLDLGPDKTIYAVGDEFSINTTRASRKPNSQAISRTRCQTTSRTSMPAATSTIPATTFRRRARREALPWQPENRKCLVR